MSDSQDLPYTARVAAMSRKKLVAAIVEVLGTHLQSGTNPFDDERLQTLMEEDMRRDGMAYDDAVEKLNEAVGFRKKEPGKFDMRG